MSPRNLAHLAVCVSLGATQVFMVSSPAEAQLTQPAGPPVVAVPISSNALAGAIPIVISAPYMEPGKVTETRGDVVKDYWWVVPGNASYYRTTRVALGFKGVFTRITVSTITWAGNAQATLTLYKNGSATRLGCTLTGHTCSFDSEVPIEVTDRINIGVNFPKSEVCRTTGNGCAGLTPIITLMVRMAQ